MMLTDDSLLVHVNNDKDSVFNFKTHAMTKVKKGAYLILVSKPASVLAHFFQASVLFPGRTQKELI